MNKVLIMKIYKMKLKIFKITKSNLDKINLITKIIVKL